MPLRDPSLVGLPDPRELSPRTDQPSERAPKRPTQPRANRRTEERSPVSSKLRDIGRSAAAPEPDELKTATAELQLPSPPSLAEEPREFLQIMCPPAIRRRLEVASFELAATHPKLKDQQTIIAALLWRYLDHEDATRLTEASELLSAFGTEPVSELRPDVKIGARVPWSLKRQLAGTVLRLHDTLPHTSGRQLLSALIWRHVDAEQRRDELISLVSAYDAELHPPSLSAASTNSADPPVVAVAP